MRVRVLRWSLPVVVMGGMCGVLAWRGYAQQPNPGQQPIKVQVNEVIVPVTVTDEKGRFVSNLEQKDFQIFDQGKEQKIEYFTRERNQPVVVGFLIDLSNNSRTQWKNWEAAAEEMVLQMLPDDNPEMRKRMSGYLIGYGNEAELMVDTTLDPEPFLNRLRKLKPAGGSALYDAIYQACTNRKLIQGEPVEPRRIIIIVGDGNDNHSSKTLEQVLELAQRNLVTIYGVSTIYSGFTSEGSDALTKLAEDTGDGWNIHWRIRIRTWPDFCRSLAMKAITLCSLARAGMPLRSRLRFSDQWPTWWAKSRRSIFCATFPTTPPRIRPNNSGPSRSASICRM